MIRPIPLEEMRTDRDHRNYYDILETPHSSTQKEIAEAYHRCKNTYHSDNIALHSIMTESQRKQSLDEIEAAYSVLGESSKRVSYDRARGINQDQPTGYHDISKPSGQKNRLEDKLTMHREAEVSKITAYNRFALDYEIDEQMEEEIEACQHFTGEFLQKIRLYKGVDIPRMNDMTKISKTYLKKIEEEDIKNLPALAYVRGFVYQYAKTLKLNPDLVANSYIQTIKEKV